MDRLLVGRVECWGERESRHGYGGTLTLGLREARASKIVIECIYDI